VRRALALVPEQLQPGYATSKVDVRAAVIRDGCSLLEQERADAVWCMPGGWADVGETPAKMVVRETRAESGSRVVGRKVIRAANTNRLRGTSLQTHNVPPFAEKRRPMRFSPDRRYPL
jgi:ADP-ribose pyrophosphatase YjhB (NUDIX family)